MKLDHQTRGVNQHFSVWPPCLTAIEHVGWCWFKFHTASNIRSDNLQHFICSRVGYENIFFFRLASLKPFSSPESALLLDDAKNTNSDYRAKNTRSRSKSLITWASLARLGGLPRLAEIPARLRNTPKIKFAITWTTSAQIAEISALRCQDPG